jgi:hypothetical protein
MSSRRESDFLQRIKELEHARQAADRRAEEEQRAREEADRRVEEEQRARQEADRRAEEEQQARREADRRAEEEKQARREAEQHNQKTTFREFLQACHEYLHKPLRVETNKSWTTKSFTKTANKYYPKPLKPWADFPLKQKEVFSKADDIFRLPKQSTLRLFSPILSIEDQGRLHCNIRLANEASLRIYEKLAVENQVTDIINRLCETVQGQEGFQLGQGIIFENDPNSLSDMAEEVQKRLYIRPPRTPSPGQSPPNHPT